MLIVEKEPIEVEDKLAVFSWHLEFKCAERFEIFHEKI